MASNEDPARYLLPYLQRADELQKHDPLVAYYCRLYAMEKGMQVPANERSKDLNGLLMSIIGQLEKDNKVISVSPDDNLHVEGFAQNVFLKADKIDRAGKADINTAKTFYAASIFFEVLRQFGDVQPDIDQKQKYAVWKAADIRKAIGEGRRPNAGPPGGNEIDAFGDLDLSGSLESQSRSQSLEPTAPPSTYPETTPSELRTQSLPIVHSLDDLGLPSAPSAQIVPPSYQSQSSTYSEVAPSQSKVAFPSGYGMPYNSQNAANPTTQPQGGNLGGFGSPTVFGGGNVPGLYPGGGVGGRFEENTQSSFQNNSQPSVPPSNAPQNFPRPAKNATYGGEYGSFSNPASSTPAITPPPVGILPNSSHNMTYDTNPVKAADASKIGTYASSSSNFNSSSFPSVSSALPMSREDYTPPPEACVEAHKAARFAVSALAFDDIPTAVDFLSKSLALLTGQTRT